MAEYLQAPPRNPVLGLLSDILASGKAGLNSATVNSFVGNPYGSLLLNEKDKKLPSVPVGDYTLFQAPEFLNNMSYGNSPLIGGSGLQARLDPRALDVLPIASMAYSAGKPIAKTLGKEVARQVETRTGLLGSNVMNPRTNIVPVDNAKGLLNQSDNYFGMPSSFISESGIGKAPATSPTGISTALSQRFDEAFQTTDAMPSFSVFAKPTARPLNDLTPTNSSTGLINFPDIQSPKVDKGIYQDYNTLNEIKQNILPYKQNLQGFLDNYSNVLGLEPGRASTRIKDDYKIGLKLNSGKAPNEISDYLGGRLVVDKPEQAQSVLGDLQKRGNVLKIDNWLNDTGKGDGYRAIHVQLGLNNGTSTEVQLVPKQLLDVYEKYKPIYDQQKHKISGDLYGDEAVKFRKILEQAKIDRNTAWEKLKQQIE